jgi:hypothetical protein
MLRRRRLEVKESAVILVSVISMTLANDVGEWLIELRECVKLLKSSAIFGRH